jgi:hypothetical protein
MTAAGQTARTWALQARLFHRDVAVLAYGGTATFELGIVVELPSTGEPVGADCKLSCLRFHVFSPYLFTRSDASSLAVQLFGMSKSTAPWGSISVKEIRPDFHKTLSGFEIVPNHLRFTGS